MPLGRVVQRPRTGGWGEPQLTSGPPEEVGVEMQVLLGLLRGRPRPSTVTAVGGKELKVGPWSRGRPRSPVSPRCSSIIQREQAAVLLAAAAQRSALLILTSLQLLSFIIRILKLVFFGFFKAV